MDHLPVPLDSYDAFESYYEKSEPPQPCGPPVQQPTQSFWTHPGLSKDWPHSKDDPDGSKNANPLAREGSDGPMATEADLVIIGSGITGVSVALELGKLVRKAQPGKPFQVIILEARDFCESQLCPMSKC